MGPIKHRYPVCQHPYIPCDLAAYLSTFIHTYLPHTLINREQPNTTVHWRGRGWVCPSEPQLRTWSRSQNSGTTVSLAFLVWEEEEGCGRWGGTNFGRADTGGGDVQRNRGMAFTILYLWRIGLLAYWSRTKKGRWCPGPPPQFEKGIGVPPFFILNYFLKKPPRTGVIFCAARRRGKKTPRWKEIMGA